MRTIKAEIRQLKKIGTEESRKKLIPLLRRYLAGKESDTRAWYDLACCCDSLGREREAEPCYARVYQDWRALPQKERPGFFLGYGSTLRNNKKLRLSEAVLGEGVRRFPGCPELKVFLALTLYTKKDFRRSARSLFEACAALPPGSLGGYGRAIEYYVKALK